MRSRGRWKTVIYAVELQSDQESWNAGSKRSLWIFHEDIALNFYESSQPAPKSRLTLFFLLFLSLFRLQGEASPKQTCDESSCKEHLCVLSLFLICFLSPKPKQKFHMQKGKHGNRDATITKVSEELPWDWNRVRRAFGVCHVRACVQVAKERRKQGFDDFKLHSRFIG